MEEQFCERCHQPFICNPTNIEVCDCRKIILTSEEIAYIAKRYSNCVCNTCLLHLKNDYLVKK